MYSADFAVIQPHARIDHDNQSIQYYIDSPLVRYSANYQSIRQNIFVADH